MPIRGALEGFFAARNQADQEESSDLKKAAALQSLMANVQASQRAAALRGDLAQSGGDLEKAAQAAILRGDLAGAHQLAPLLEIKRKADEQRMLAGVDMNDPEQLKRVALALKKPEFQTHAERILADRAKEAELASMRGAPAQTIQPDVQEVEQAADRGVQAPQPATVAGTPGIFDTLVASKYPDIAQAAKNYQAQMASPNARAISPQTWMGYATNLQNRQTALDTRQEPAPHVMTDSEGRTWQVDRNGNARQVMAGGKPLVAKGAPIALGEDALTNAAWEKILFGTEMKGLGTASSQQRGQVRDLAAHITKELGLTPAEAAMLPQDNKVKQKAIGNLTNWGATVERSSLKVEKDLAMALDYGKQLPLGQMQTINKGVIAGQKEFNNPIANGYAAAINELRQEYARLQSGPTSNAMLPVEAMKKGNELISSGVDVPSLQEIGNVIRKTAANSRAATESSIAQVRQTMVPGAATGPKASGPLTPAEQAELDSLRARYPRGR